MSSKYAGGSASDLPQSSRRFPTHSILAGNQLHFFPRKIHYFRAKTLFTSLRLLFKSFLQRIFVLIFMLIFPNNFTINMREHKYIHCLNSGVGNPGQFLLVQEDWQERVLWEGKALFIPYSYLNNRVPNTCEFLSNPGFLTKDKTGGDGKLSRARRTICSW